MSYDHITKDLCRKATQDTKAVVDRACSLLDDPRDMMLVAVSAAAGPLASGAGFVISIVRQNGQGTATPEEAVDCLWEVLRPLILKAAGGDDADYSALLAAAR